MAARPFRFRRLTAPLHASLGRTRSIYTGARFYSWVSGSAASAFCLAMAALAACESNKKGREKSELLRVKEGMFVSDDETFWKTLELIRSLDPKEIPTENLLSSGEKFVAVSGSRRDLGNAGKSSVVEALPEKDSQDPIFNKTKDNYKD